MNPLQTLQKTDPAQVDRLSIEQVLALCGSGRLSDSSQCSQDLREYLQNARSENLFKYLQSCLDSHFDRSGFVLQDIINEFGRRLDYTVENGLYQGRSNAVGFDGLWLECGGHAIVVEVKTSDAYRVNLDTVAGYRDALITSGKITDDSSVLIVVGRQDTGDLEAQVRGSRHAWTIRIISADSLSKLVALKESTETDSVPKMHELLIPFEYTRVDKIIEIAFTVAKDATSAVESEEVSGQVGVADTTSTGTQKQQRTSPQIIDEVRAEIVRALSSKYAPLVRKSRALYWSADRSLRAVVTVSKEYKSGGYWYAYHSAWDAFLTEGKEGFFVLGCVGRSEAFALPNDWVHSRREHFNVTERGDDTYWHIYLDPDDNGQLMLWLKNGKKESVEPFKIQLSGAAVVGS